MDFTIRVASIYIEIHSVYSDIYELCKDFLTTECVKPDIDIRTDKDAINAEFEQIRNAGQEI